MRAMETSIAIHGALMAACLVLAGLCGPGDSGKDAPDPPALIGFSVEPPLPKRPLKGMPQSGKANLERSEVWIFSCFVGPHEDH